MCCACAESGRDFRATKRATKYSFPACSTPDTVPSGTFSSAQVARPAGRFLGDSHLSVYGVSPFWVA